MPILETLAAASVRGFSAPLLKPASLLYAAGVSSSQASGSTRSFNNVNFGPEGPDRLLVALTEQEGSSVASMTIGGVAAFSLASRIWAVRKSDGLSGNISAVLNSSSNYYLRLALYNCIGILSHTPVDFLEAAGGIKVKAGGIVLAGARSDSTGSHTWTGLTQNFSASWGTKRASFASRQFPDAVAAHPVNVTPATRRGFISLR